MLERAVETRTRRSETRTCDDDRRRRQPVRRRARGHRPRHHAGPHAAGRDPVARRSSSRPCCPRAAPTAAPASGPTPRPTRRRPGARRPGRPGWARRRADRRVRPAARAGRHRGRWRPLPRRATRPRWCSARRRTDLPGRWWSGRRPTTCCTPRRSRWRSPRPATAARPPTGVPPRAGSPAPSTARTWPRPPSGGLRDSRARSTCGCGSARSGSGPPPCTRPEIGTDIESEVTAQWREQMTEAQAALRARLGDGARRRRRARRPVRGAAGPRH